MKVYELVAAAVLRVGQKDGSMRALSWTELGQAFGITKDQARHQLNRFKEKYNVVDADVHTPGWNREFLAQHTPEAEKPELAGSAIAPGDVIKVGEVVHVFTNAKGNTRFLDANDTVQFGFVPNPKLSAGRVYSNYEQGVEDVYPNDQQEDEGDLAIPLEFQEQRIEQKVQIEPLKHLITPTVIVVVRDEVPLSLDKSHKNFDKIKDALAAQDWQKVLDLIDMKNTLQKYSNGRVIVEDGRVTLDGERVDGKVVDRLVDSLMEENLEALEGIANFLSNADENPDHRVVTRIFDFISHNDLRLDKEGYIHAYKVVKHNYFDKYTGTMDNSPGQVVKMKRNKVNPRDNETCSFGLHVAAKRYIPSYGTPNLGAGGDRVVLCRVHPKDFVSIPTDYNSMKARVCEYEVLKDVTELFVKGKDLDEEDSIKA